MGIIRSYEDKDVEGLLDVWYRASLIAHHFLDDEFFENERIQIKESWLPISDTVVWEHENRVIGFLSLVGNEVGAIFVDPDHQGQGVGRALMDWASEARPYLELDVFEANARGRSFYEAYGFKFLDRHVHEASGQNELRLRLDKRSEA